MKLDPYITPNTKIKLKWIKYLNKRPEPIKCLEDIGEMLHGIGLGNDFIHVTLKI